jgi:hypothetical protein
LQATPSIPILGIANRAKPTTGPLVGRAPGFGGASVMYDDIAPLSLNLDPGVKAIGSTSIPTSYCGFG